MILAEVQEKWSVILIDLLGSDIASTLWMKEQVLHRERKCSRNRHLKVPGWSLVWNELLTKKLPMFLSRLNEISEGCEKIVPVSASFWSNWKFLRIIDLTAWLWEKQDSHVYRKNCTSPLIFRKSQSRHYINDKGWETVKKVWMRGWMRRWIKQVTAWVCRLALKHWCIDRCLQLSEISQVYCRAG